MGIAKQPPTGAAETQFCRVRPHVTEALKHAFADRAEFLGDTDFVEVPVDKLLHRDYAAQIARRIEPGRTRPMAEYGRFFLPSDGGTSHFSVMDNKGNAVACTETINLTFGSFVVVPGVWHSAE